MINERKGGNDLVEKKRGTKHKDLKFNWKLNTEHITKAEYGVVLTAAAAADMTIDLHVQDYANELLEFELV